MTFKLFITEGEKNMKDASATLSSIPKKHAALVKGYKFCFQPDNTLKGDDKHVGIIDDEKKTITIAAPWNYSREWVLLHELAHILWKNLAEEKKTEWIAICNATALSKDEKDVPEELFCHSYASVYCGNKSKRFDHPKWKNFIKKL